MSKLSELVESQSQPATKKEGIKVDISGNCGVCYSDVDEAEYFPEHRVLRYVCQNTHISYLEDFML